MFKDQVKVIKESRKKMYNMLEYKETELRNALLENPKATLDLFKECDETSFRMVHLYSEADDYCNVNYYLTVDIDFDIECVGYSTDGDIYDNLTYDRILELLNVYDLEYVYDYLVRNIERIKNGEELRVDY